jgi:hypothetical protein
VSSTRVIAAIGWVFLGFVLGASVVGYRAHRSNVELAEAFLEHRATSDAARAAEDLALLARLEAQPAEARRDLERRIDRHIRSLEEAEPETELASDVLAKLRAHREQRPSPPRRIDGPDGPIAGALLHPVYESGRLVGLRVSEIARDSRWQAMGLHDGDVVVSLDDARLDSPAALADLLETLAERRGFTAVPVSEGRFRLVSPVE